MADHLLEPRTSCKPGAIGLAPTGTFIHEGKRRKISAAPFRDRVVHHALCAIIEPAFERRFIFDSYANRAGKGTHRAVDRLQQFARRHRYVLRLDIVKHFPSLDHAILRERLAEVIRDEAVLWLVDAILASGVGVLDEEYAMVWFPAMTCSPPAARAACPSAI
ncbi:MAG: hypothetical protein IPK63_22790 [Candidatus Competibacteraceae bacterium]|nr:hypothetical protein [Candidatus Competibacteraceae bacterium]